MNIGRRRMPAIQRVIEIAEEYASQGYRMTARQVHYQHVTRGYLTNTTGNCKLVTSYVQVARWNGLLDWDWIVDEGRYVRESFFYDDPQDAICTAARAYRIDTWASQPSRVQVWIEKDALLGVLEPICREFRVPYYSARGFSSNSAQKKTSDSFREVLLSGQDMTILHIGDHDPSGWQATESQRLVMEAFVRGDLEADGHSPAQVSDLMHRVEFRRIALNQDQILALALPPNPVKMNDSRAAKYMRYMTTSAFADPSFCWEVDALTPPQITAVLRDALTSMIDQQSWQASLRQEELEKQQVSAVAGRWDEVQAFLAGGQLPT